MDKSDSSEERGGFVSVNRGNAGSRKKKRSRDLHAVLIRRRQELAREGYLLDGGIALQGGEGEGKIF